MNIGRLLTAAGWTETASTPAQLYLRSYPIFATPPRMMSKILLPPDSGTDYPAVQYTGVLKAGYSVENVSRIMLLLQSDDQRQRKRGTRLAKVLLR